MKSYFFCAAVLFTAANGYADLISEFEPNPAGGDPDDSTIELSGTANLAYNFNIYSIENDGISGLVDRATNVTGSFDALGLSVVTVPDLENPSFTLLLTDGNIPLVATGTDLDATDSGVLDVSNLGTIFDSVGVSDNGGDDGTLYSTGLGGSSILFNGEFEPLSVFRDASTGEFFQTVTVDFGGANEHIGVFAANGGPELNVATFSSDPTATTFGAINPTVTAVPEPSSIACLTALGAGGVYRRVRRKKVA